MNRKDDTSDVTSFQLLREAEVELRNAARLAANHIQMSAQSIADINTLRKRTINFFRANNIKPK